MAKRFTLYGNGPSPNPPKVAIMLEELGLPYEVKQPEGNIKEEPFISLNPNGRLPALIDHEADITLFESGAIAEYLFDQFDKENKFQYTSLREKYLARSWLHFQMSGQGPYFGQLAWFKYFHPEKDLTSVIDRYTNEVKRVVGVVDAHLSKQKTPFLVGDKLTYADLAFIPWFAGLDSFLVAGWDYKKEYPAFGEWLGKLLGRESVKKVYAMEIFQRKEH